MWQPCPCACDTELAPSAARLQPFLTSADLRERDAASSTLLHLGELKGNAGAQAAMQQSQQTADEAMQQVAQQADAHEGAEGAERKVGVTTAGNHCFPARLTMWHGPCCWA